MEPGFQGVQTCRDGGIFPNRGKRKSVINSRAAGVARGRPCVPASPPPCCRPSVLGTAASFLREEVPEDGKPVMDHVAAGPVSLGKWPLRLHVVIADAPFGLF